MAILEAIPGIVGAVRHSILAVVGWRYLLSHSYRNSVHVRWKNMSLASVAFEVFIYFISFVMVTLVLIIFILFFLLPPMFD